MGIRDRDEDREKQEWMNVICIFFFFKQKTAYELMPSLVGSEMCIKGSAYSGDASFNGGA